MAQLDQTSRGQDPHIPRPGPAWDSSQARLRLAELVNHVVRADTRAWNRIIDTNADILDPRCRKIYLKNSKLTNFQSS